MGVLRWKPPPPAAAAAPPAFSAISCSFLHCLVWCTACWKHSNCQSILARTRSHNAHERVRFIRRGVRSASVRACICLSPWACLWPHISTHRILMSASNAALAFWLLSSCLCRAPSTSNPPLCSLACPSRLCLRRVRKFSNFFFQEQHSDGEKKDEVPSAKCAHTDTAHWTARRRTILHVQTYLRI